MEGEPEAEAQLFPTTVGEKLRAARESQGLDLAEIAASTRIPQRHLEAIERSNYASLPSITYALGFAKAYARAVGADEVAIARELRGELSTSYEPRSTPTAPSYDMDGPRRSAPGGLVWITLAVAVLLAAGAAAYYATGWFRGNPAAETDSLVLPEETPTPDANAIDANAVVPASGGQVSLIALGKVWVRVTDGSGKTLFEKEMQEGDRYDVPPDADHPRARVPRPDMIQVTLNGSKVAPLGTGAQTVDVEISADALLARGQPSAAATPGPDDPLAVPPARAPAPRRLEVPAPVGTDQPSVTNAD